MPPLLCKAAVAAAAPWSAPVRTLIVEDEYISRVLLLEVLAPLGTCDVATTGSEAVDLIGKAFAGGSCYDLICLDILIPEPDGQQVLKTLRDIEAERDIDGKRTTRVIMTTGLDDSRSILEAFTVGKCDAYLTKPVDGEKLRAQLRQMQLIGTTGTGRAG